MEAAILPLPVLPFSSSLLFFSVFLASCSSSLRRPPRRECWWSKFLVAYLAVHRHLGAAADGRSHAASQAGPQLRPNPSVGQQVQRVGGAKGERSQTPRKIARASAHQQAPKRSPYQRA
eukprot:GHVT01075600.1.p4 GENE.GHVT01075600.1~~GHVT01075600.1.p4  ORF type:complete len:119 (+),score=28.49 GHVT01075600.1:459-815(+)